MRTALDPRHKKRIKILKALYCQQFSGTKAYPLKTDENKLFRDLKLHLVKINQEIDKYAKRFPTERMAKIDLSILQLGIYELLIRKQTPYKVIVDECIELAKEFGASKSASFVNGILGKLVEGSHNE